MNLILINRMSSLLVAAIILFTAGDAFATTQKRLGVVTYDQMLRYKVCKKVCGHGGGGYEIVDLKNEENVEIAQLDDLPGVANAASVSFDSIKGEYRLTLSVPESYESSHGIEIPGKMRDCVFTSNQLPLSGSCASRDYTLSLTVKIFTTGAFSPDF